MANLICAYCRQHSAVALREDVLPPSRTGVVKERIRFVAVHLFCTFHQTVELGKRHKLLAAGVVVCPTVFIAGAAIGIGGIAAYGLLVVTGCTAVLAFTVLLETTCVMVVLIALGELGFIYCGISLYERKEVFYKELHALDASAGRIDDKNVCLILEATTDYNGAFTRVGCLKKIEKKYPVVIKEVSSMEGIELAVAETREKVRSIRMLVIRGHGSQRHIELGKENGQMIHERLRECEAGLRNIEEYLHPEAPVLLDSCETASIKFGKRNVAGLVSEHLRGHHVWASKTSFSLPELRVCRVEPFSVEIRATQSRRRVKTLACSVALVFLSNTAVNRFLSNQAVCYRDGAIIGQQP